MASFELKPSGGGTASPFTLPGGNGGTIASSPNEIASVIQQTTRCPICLMKYNNPKRLQCDHSFCRNCLQGELDRQKQKGSGTLTCIVCQEPVSLPKNGGVDQLDSILIIHDITRFYQMTPKPKVQCSKCNNTYCSSCINLVCNRCDKYISTEFCTDCFEGFCSRCAEEHEKTTGDHILVDVDQAHDMIKEVSDDEDENGEGEGGLIEGDHTNAAAALATASMLKEEQTETIKENGLETSRQAEAMEDTDSEVDFEFEVKDSDDEVAAVKGQEEDSDSNESALDFVYDLSGSNNRRNSDSAIPVGDSEDDDGEVNIISHTRNFGSDPIEEDDLDSEGSEGYVEQLPSSVPVGEGTTQNPLFVMQNETMEDSDNSSNSSHIIVAYNTSEGLPDTVEDSPMIPSGDRRYESQPTSSHTEEATLGNEGEEQHEQQERERRVLLVESREDTENVPATVHDYENLQQAVNATYRGELSPEEEARLNPSAPQSDRRKRVARIRADRTHDPKLPEKYYEIKSLKWCSRITIGFVLVLTMCTLALAGLAVTAYLLSSDNISVHTFQNYVVLVDKPHPFWIRSLSVDAAGAYDNTYDYETTFYLMPCNDLKTKDVNYSVVRTGTQPVSSRDITVSISTGRDNTYVYLTPGSIIDFSVLVWSDYTYTKCISEFNLYNNYNDFAGDEGVNAIYSNCIEIKQSPTDVPTNFSYTVTEADFYFVTLSVPQEGSYRVIVTVDGATYDVVNVNHTGKQCTILSTTDSIQEQCDFNLIQSNIVWSADKQCMIAETQPYTSTPSSAASFVRFSVSYSPNIFRNFAYIVIISPVPLYFIMCLLVWLCFKGCNVMYVQCKNWHFKHEYQVTEI